MSRVTKNALKGYGYQHYVALLFCFFLEFYSKDFEELECEINKESEHNFDDILLKTKNDAYYIQAKNYSSNNDIAVIKDGYVEYCGQKSKLADGYTNIFVCNSPIPTGISSNISFYEIPAIEDPETKTIIIYLTIDSIYSYISQKSLNDRRANELEEFFTLKLLNDNDIKIHQAEIPKFVLYSNDLVEKTHLIRTMTESSFNGNVVFVVAPPGFGKSHLVNELHLESRNIYRFWISSDDYDCYDRLQYDNFITYLSNSLFLESRKRSEEEVIEAVSRLNGWLVLDGLDHVYNYYLRDFEKYKSFVEKCVSKPNARIIVMTRPLNDTFYSKYTVIELKPWSEDECRTYCTYEGVVNKWDQDKMFNVTGGYPIITRYLCDEYKHNGGIVRDLNKMNSVEDYYQDLLSSNKRFDGNIKQLGAFCVLYPFVHLDDIAYLYGPAMINTFKGIAEVFPQIITFKNDRFFFYHDSLYCFIKERCSSELLIGLKDKIVNSLLKGEVLFMARAPLNSFEKGSLKRIIAKYCDFDFFVSLFNDTFDIESIKTFYDKITICLASANKQYINIYQTYSLIMILLLISRNYFDDNRNLSIQIYEQLKMANVDWKHLVYSNGYLFKNLSFIEEKKLYLKKCQNTYYSRFEGDDSLEEGYSLESTYFNVIKYDVRSKIANYLQANKKHLDSYLFSEYLVSGFIHGDEDCRQTMAEYIGRTIHDYYLTLSVKKRFGFIDKDIDSFQIGYACKLANSRLKCLGYLSGIADYNCIKELLDYNKTDNTFDMYVSLNGYIRYSTKHNRKINLNEIYPYLLMMGAHKDVTISYLPEAMAFYVKKGVFTLKECIKWIKRVYELIDDGNKGFATAFATSLGEKYVEELLKLNFFNDDQPFYVFIEDLPTEVINCLPFGMVQFRTYKLLCDSSFREKEADCGKLGNIIHCKHIKKIKTFLSGYGITIKRPEKKKQEQTKEEAPTYAQLKYGCYRESYKQEYIKYGFSIEDMAKLRSGWGFKLSDLSIFDIFKKEVVAKNIKKIINSAAFNNDDYRQYHQYCVPMLYTIPKLCELYNVDFDCKKGGKLLKNYIKTILRL